jgi:hypothetical protein
MANKPVSRMKEVEKLRSCRRGFPDVADIAP